MAKPSKILQLIASKLGFSDEKNVLSKAVEIELRLQVNSTSICNITDFARAVICVNLAADAVGTACDVKTAIKLSGLKASAYANTKKILQNFLEINDERLTTAMLCIVLQCSGVEELADRILDLYQSKARLEIDLNLPQYVCMAVFQACRMKKVKVPKSKFIEKSRLKPAQWSNLDRTFTKIVEENFTTAKKKKGKPATKGVEEEIEEVINISPTKQEKPQKPQIEPYEDWKRRILEQAYKALEAEKNRDTYIQEQGEQKETERNVTPRRSPRKTPKKYEPYKSPSKMKGVRLLFPPNF